MTATAPGADRRLGARLGPRSIAVLGVATVLGLLMFLWPLFVHIEPGTTRVDPPFIMLALLPIIVLAVVAELTEDGMDSKALAMLGVLTAVNAALRALGAGTAGIEMVFFLLVLSGRVFGPGFGYVLGCTSLFMSALLTAGVGPWLPFQMMASAWIGLGAGLLPNRIGGRQVRGRLEIAMLCGYGVVVAYGFGILMNMSSWPLLAGVELANHEGSLSFVPDAPLLDNLHRFAIYTLLTSTAGWDTGRAITNVVAIIVLGPAILATLRRAARRARWSTSGEPTTSVR